MGSSEYGMTQVQGRWEGAALSLTLQVKVHGGYAKEVQEEPSCTGALAYSASGVDGAGGLLVGAALLDVPLLVLALSKEGLGTLVEADAAPP